MKATLAKKAIALLLSIVMVLPSLSFAATPPAALPPLPEESGGQPPLLTAQALGEVLVSGSSSLQLPLTTFGYYEVSFKAADGQPEPLSGDFSLRLVDNAGAAVAASAVYSLVEQTAFGGELLPIGDLTAGSYTLEVLQDGVSLPGVTIYGTGSPGVTILPPPPVRVDVQGSDTWVAGAVRSLPYSFWFSDLVSGSLQVSLLAGDQVVAAAPPIHLINEGWAQAFLHPFGALAPGNYRLQATLNGEPLSVSLQNVQPPLVKVIADRRVLAAAVQPAPGHSGNWPTVEDREIFVQVTASGLARAEDLHVQILDGSEAPITTTGIGRLQDQDTSGEQRLFYRLPLFADQPLQAGMHYLLRISSAADEQLLYAGSYTVPHAPSIEEVRVDLASTGDLTLTLANIPAGKLSVELLREEGLEYLAFALASDLNYDAQGTLAAQLFRLDDQSKPALLTPGYYQVRVKRGSDELGRYGFSVPTSPNQVADSLAYREAAILNGLPAHLAAAGGRLDFTCTLANVLPTLPVVELVKSTAAGLVSVATADAVQWSAEQSGDPTRYRYINTALLQVGITLPPLEADASYRWQISCTDRQGVELALLPLEAPAVHETPFVGELKIAQGIMTMSFGGHHGQEPPTSSYYLGLHADALDVTLLDTWGLLDSAGVSVTLLAADDTVVGNLVAPAAPIGSGQWQGRVSVNSPWLDQEVRQLVVSYGGVELRRCQLIGMAEVGAQQLSVSPWNIDSLIFSAGDSLTLRIQKAINLQPGQLGLKLTPLQGGEAIAPAAPATVIPSGGDMVMQQTFNAPLQGWYQLQVEHQGLPLQEIMINEGYDGEGVTIGTQRLDPISIYFTASAFLSGTGPVDSGYQLFGQGFSATRTYQAAIFSADDSALALQRVPVEFLDGQTLQLSDQSVQDFPRGIYRVYLLEDGVIVPSTRDLHLILRTGEKVIIEPQASINAGAEFTFKPEVSLRLDPGTFTEVKWAESLTGLAEASYQTVAPTASYRFTDALGEKKLYFRFRDQDGLESSLLTRQIQLVSTTLAAPTEFGVDADAWRAGQTVTAWLRTALPGVVASLELHRTDTSSTSHNLSKALVEYGVTTYAKQFVVSSADADVVGVSFHLLDGRTGAKWDSAVNSVSFSHASELRQARSNWQKAYFEEQLIVADSPVRFMLAGTSGLAATATVTYQVGATEHELVVPLTEEANGSRTYRGERNVPAGATRILRVDYSLSGTGFDPSVSSETVGLGVTGGVRFLGLANGSGVYDGSMLWLEAKSPLSSQQQWWIEGNLAPEFLGQQPGTYTYRLLRNGRDLAAGEITLAAGEIAEVSLSQARVPAELLVQATPAVMASVSYHIVGVDGLTWDDYTRLGRPLSGLLIGDKVSYQVSLSHANLLTYVAPPPVDPATPLLIEQASTVHDLTLEPIPMVTVVGKVLDEAYNQAGLGDRPVAGVSVQLNQESTNGGVRLFNNQRVTTAADGSFSLQLYKDQGGTVRFHKANYQIADLELVPTAVDLTLPTAIYAAYADRGLLRYTALVAAPVRAGETAVWDTGNVNLRVKSVKAGDQVLTGRYRGNGEYQLTEESLAGLSAGQTLTMEFWSVGHPYQLVSNSIDLVLNPYRSAAAEVKLHQLGHLTATLESADNPESSDHLLVFYKANSRGNSYLLANFSGSGMLSTESRRLAPGEYVFVCLRGAGLSKVHNLSTLGYLDDLGLVAGNDYLEQVASLQYGQITDLGLLPAPRSLTDEELGYLATAGTSISLRPDGFSADNKMKLAVTLRYRLRDNIIAAGGVFSSLNLLLRPFGEGVVIKSAVYLNGTMLAANEVSTHGIAVSGLGAAKYGANGGGSRQGVLTFQVETELSQLEINASISVNYQGRWRQETIVSQQFDLPFVSIADPPEVFASPTDSLSLTLTGVAYKDSTVTITDNGVVAGQAVADGRGNWKTTIKLSDPTLPGAHQLQASVLLPDQTVAESLIVTCQVLPRSAAVVDEVEIWQDRHGITRTRVSFTDQAFSGGLPFYPSPTTPVKAKFKILNVLPEEVEVAAMVNTYRGSSTMYPATYDQASGYWLVEAYGIKQPGTFSIFFSLKVQSDPQLEASIVGKMTGSTPIDVNELPAQPEVDPASLPQTFRGLSNPTGYEDGSGPSGNDRIAASYNLGDGMQLEFVGTRQTVTSSNLPTGAIRIATNQGYYYTTAPNVSVGNNSISVQKTVWFSPELWAAIGGGGVGGQSLRGAMVMQGTQDNLQRLDYTSTGTGIAGDLYELRKGANTLGRLGKGLTALGGVSLAANVLMGRIGTDPAELRAAAGAVEDTRERAYLMGQIDEYAAATSKSHYINSFMGSVSYGASFFGPLGKGLSYVVTTGGQVFSNKIGSEYQIWSDAIISMIRSALEKQERNKKSGKKKDILDPRWIMDPSGYVFQATESERIEGITATLLLDDGVSYRPWTVGDEDDYLIDPLQNPLTTDPQGKYGWDVSLGNWKVRFAGADYQTVETKAMTVPPAHTEVNVGLLSRTAPAVQAVHVFPDAVEIEFDSYLLPSSLAGNIGLWDEAGNPLAIKEVQLVAPVANTGYTGDGAYSPLKIPATEFVRRVKVVPAVPTGKLAQFAADGETNAKYRVRIEPSVASYSSVPMAAAYDQLLTVEARDHQSLSGVVRYAAVSGSSLAGVAVRLEHAGNLVATATTAADGSYSFTGIGVGSYTLQFSLASHVHRSIAAVEVTAGGAKVIDTTLALRGDANLDGYVNGADIVPINRHALSIELIVDALALLAADANQDGYVNGADIVPVNRHALGIELMP